jgi:hypothetical protein
MTKIIKNRNNREMVDIFIPATGNYISVRARIAKSNTTSPIMEKLHANMLKKRKNQLTAST